MLQSSDEEHRFLETRYLAHFNNIQAAAAGLYGETCIRLRRMKRPYR